MERFDIFKDITERTGGDIYIGVVGPVRTGKSTFIKRFMEQMVIPNIVNSYDRERSQDELPQSGNGRTIMTTEPKFVPSEAVEVQVGENIKFKVRMVDCVGYAVEGAIGYQSEDGPRMVYTPWYEEPISFVEAAEIGTQKVITDHSTVGLVVTTDGSITDFPRESYLNAEERVINELKAIGKPFVVLLNSVNPEDAWTEQLVAELQAKYQVPVIALNCMQLNPRQVEQIIQQLLYMFPLREIKVDYPNWIEELDFDHWLRSRFEEAIIAAVADVEKVRDIDQVVTSLKTVEDVSDVVLKEIDLGEGCAHIEMLSERSLFFKVLEEISGLTVNGDHHLMRIMKELSVAKKEYDKVAEALLQVREKGYGIVQPILDELTLAEPELIRHGNRFGVKLKASAPSIHMIRAEIITEVTPIVGTEKQGEEFVKYLTEEFEKDPARIWETDFFGKSMFDLVREGIQSKLTQMPENAQEKLQETLSKIINDGTGGLICIIL
ncbi:MAG TPA: stage IV sporulation protein A [Bacillota bacterium]|nr:stage IV sporulation protein A [Bacillota bacterium]HOL08577.1 stage IV sporulation protein A [Bacillota bacterium]HPO97809.1 stage IV sporulation protein A [Bacillota bacterium]